MALFYSCIVSCVLVNGVQSDFFSVTRGVRQGFPLSRLLYFIIAETLANAIRANSLIDCFPLPSTRYVKICQYADDTSIVVMCDAALREVFTVFDRYEFVQSKLNITKSHSLLVGTLVFRSDLPIALDWSSTSIIVLGTTLSNTIDEEEWDNKLSSLDSVFNTWKQHTLCFHGCAMIANTLGLSIFWYFASFMCIPEDLVRTIIQGRI